MAAEKVDMSGSSLSLVRTTMNWDQQQSLLLIAELEKHEILWNPRDKAFHNTQRKEDAWKKLADSLNAEVGEVKRKVDSLRGSFRREKSRMKKAQEAASSGAGNGIYVSNWFAFEAMKFLDLNNDIGSKNNKDPLLDFFEATESEIRDAPEYYQTEMNPDPFVSPMEIIKKRRAPSDTYSQKSYKLLKQSVSTKKDECSIYGEYITEKLRKLDEISRAQAQHKINNILFEIEMEFLKKTRYSEPAPQVTDTITFDHTLSPFQPSPKLEGDYDDEDDECSI